MRAHKHSESTTTRLRPGCARLLAVAVAMAVLFAAPLARAAVPICDEHAQTIAAPPPLVPLKAGAILPLNCPESDPFTVGAPPPPQPTRQLSVPDLPDRMLAFGYGFPPGPRHALVPVSHVADGEQPGHLSSVYRPPRG